MGSACQLFDIAGRNVPMHTLSAHVLATLNPGNLLKTIPCMGKTYPNSLSLKNTLE